MSVLCSDWKNGRGFNDGEEKVIFRNRAVRIKRKDTISVQIQLCYKRLKI